MGKIRHLLQHGTYGKVAHLSHPLSVEANVGKLKFDKPVIFNDDRQAHFSFFIEVNGFHPMMAYRFVSNCGSMKDDWNAVFGEEHK